jgi:hypothetical protein
MILFNVTERGHSNIVFEKQQCLHNQKLRMVEGQKYHPEWYFLTRPAQMIELGEIKLVPYHPPSKRTIPPAIRRRPSVLRGTLLCRQAVRLQFIAESTAPWQG